MSSLTVLLAVMSVVTACGSATHESPIRVTLTAQNHHPLVTLSGRNHQPPPNEQWWYCVRVRTTAGTSVASRIDLQIVSGRTLVRGAGTVWLRRGYDRWCGSIGGEYNLFEAVPWGKKLDFQAVVRAKGVTVRRDWPLVVR